MENGQKADILLDSGLDIKSSDMLVPVDKPQFQHNRQKYQGRYLPSSVRFEHNGWAAGNDVYEFDFAEIKLDTEGMGGLVNVYARLFNDNPTYVLLLRDDNNNALFDMILVNASRIFSFACDTCEISGTGTTVTFTGTFNSHPFTVTYDMQHNDRSLEGIEVTGEGMSLIGFLEQDDYRCRLTIRDDESSIDVSVPPIIMPTGVLVNDSEYMVGKFERYYVDAESNIGTAVYRCGAYTFNFCDDGTFYINDYEGNEVAYTPDDISPIQYDSEHLTYGGKFDVEKELRTKLSIQWQRYTPVMENVAVLAQNNSMVVAYNANKDLRINKWGFEADDISELSPGESFSVTHTLLLKNNMLRVYTDMYRWPFLMPEYHQSVTQTFLPIGEAFRNQRRNIYTLNWVKPYIPIDDHPSGNFGRVFGTNTTFIADTSTAGVRTVNCTVTAWFLVIDYETPSNNNRYDYIYEWHKVTLDYDMGQAGLAWGESDYISLFGNSSTVDVAAATAWVQDNLNIVRNAYGVPEYHEWQSGAVELVKLEMAFTGNISFGSNLNVRTSRTIAINMTAHRAGSAAISFYADILGSPSLDSIDYYTTHSTTTYRSSVPRSSVPYDIISVSDTGRMQPSVVAGSGISLTQDPNPPSGYEIYSVVRDADSYGKLKSCVTYLGPHDDGSIDSACFTIESVAVTGHLDLQASFKHKIMQVTCKDTFEMIIYLCSATDDVQYIYYTPENTSGISYDVIPPLIRYGTDNYIEMPDGAHPQRRVEIRPDYTLLSARDSDYTLALVIVGTPKKRDKDNFFRTVAGVTDDVVSDINLPGNVVTEETLPGFVNDTSFTVGPVLVRSVDDGLGYSEYVPPVGDRYQTLIMHYTGDVDSSHPDGEYTKVIYYDIDDDKVYTDETEDIGIDGIEYTGFTYSNGDLRNIGEQEVHLLFNALCHYNFNDVQLPYYTGIAAPELLSFENNIAKFVVDDILLDIDYDIKQARVFRGNNWFDCEEAWHVDSSVDITYDGSFEILAGLRGVYKGANNVDSLELSSTQLMLAFNDDTLAIDTTYMPATEIGCYFTRITEKQLRSIQFAKIKAKSELQFLKQSWDTSNEVENFWWIDKDNILVLTKNSLLRKHRTDRLSDWDGDIFSELTDDNGFSCDRNKVIDSLVLKYVCSSVYNTGNALFVTVTDEYTHIQLTIYDPLDYDNVLDEMAHFSIGLPVVNRVLGAVLNEDNKKLNTYSELSTYQIISQSAWSATCTANKLIIGVHYDNDFNQWAILCDVTRGSHTNKITSVTLDKIIQGYGFVGVDCSLTGGEIPDEYFDVNKGFDAAVYPLSVLEPDIDDTSNNAEIEALDALWSMNERVVGDAEQQWYIKESVHGVVSHLVYNNGSYVKKILPLSNTYSVNYESASYGAQVASDFQLQYKTLKDALPIDNNVWTGILVSWLYPVIYYFNPAITVANYLQQALGQASYVHYNSTALGKQKELASEKINDNRLPLREANVDHSANSSDEITFDRQTIKQEQTLHEGYSTLLTMAASAIVGVKDWAMENISSVKNEAGEDITQINLAGKYASQFFTDNMRNAAVSGMSVDTIYSSKSTEVTALKTLDMFYSTSDIQQICAGRGYVNHNFVAQCTAQSVNNMSSNYIQQKFMFCLKELTLLPMQLLLKGLENIKNGLAKDVDATGGAPFVIVGVADGGTVPIAPGLALGYLAADVACNYIKIGVELVTSLLESFGGGKLQSTIPAKQFVPYFHVEAKHRYGSKSESFMWPSFGITSLHSIPDETVEVVMQNKAWKLNIPTGNTFAHKEVQHPEFTTVFVEKVIGSNIAETFDGDVPFYDAMIKGMHTDVMLPENTAYVIGTESFLPETAFKNEFIGESAPVFPTPPFQDYIIDERWQLAQTASVGMTTWVSCRDTKLIDGDFSNIVVTDNFCGVACPYTAIEVKRGIDKKYIRPWAVTPNAIALNNTGFNCMFEEKAYHAFDGYGSRIVNWTGSPGLGKEKQTLQYAFLVNDRFKRSNKLPPNEFMGNFKGDPDIAIRGDYNDSVFAIITQPGENTGLSAGAVGEDKDVRRYALPVFSEFVNTLPAVVKTVSSQTLAVIDGVTSLTTANRDLQTAYKSPVSIDFSIGKNKYRYTYEYICSVENDDATGVTIVTELVPCLGLKFVGSTPYEAYLYSDATRQYYKFTGGTSISSVDTIERFRDVISGRYDFISQEVVLPCVATFDRLDGKVHDDDDETDNVIVPRLKDNGFIGEVPPPLDTIYNKKFRTLSLPSGVAFQGPNRCIINRFVVQDYMVDQIKSNYGKWKRVSREEYHPFREYKEKFSNVETFLDDSVSVKGWTHNPFLLVTAPLGISEAVDCMFEWEITFCWPVEMDKLYGKDNYAVVNITAETMTPGGKVVADRPAHVFLTKELFARSGNYGYYSFRYQSKCGIGNRERLHIWSDQYVCISGLQLEYKPLTQKRTEILTQQADLTGLQEI